MSHPPKRSEEMSKVDTTWLHMEDPTNLMMVTGVWMFEDRLDYERLVATLEQRFLRFHRFRQRVVEPRTPLGSPRWETDPNFDIRNHLHRVALPEPRNQSALQEFVSDVMSMPLDFSKPLWHFHLIEDFQGGSALLGRLHHCVADGMALVQVILSMTDAEPDAVWVPSPSQGPRPAGWNPFRAITRPARGAMRATRRVAGALFEEGWQLVTNPGHAVDRARLGTEGGLALARLLLLPPDPKTVFKGPLHVPKRAAWSQPIALADVKAVCRATGSTVNDVLMSAVAGALRRYLAGRGQAVDGLNFRAVIPVNLRPGMDEETIELGNRFGLVFLSLPVGLGNPLERLREVKRRMDGLKGTPEAMVAFGILYALGMAPTTIENIVVRIFGMKATLVMTNVPGPQEQLYFAGSAIKSFMFWVPQSGRLGLGISVLSYNGQVFVGVASDAYLVPDPETIVASYEEEIRQLCLAAKAAKQRAAAAGRASTQGQREPEAPSDDLTAIAGIGPAFAARLQAGGITTFAALAGSTPERVAAIIEAPDWRRPDYASWIEQARAQMEGIEHGP